MTSIPGERPIAHQPEIGSEEGKPGLADLFEDLSGQFYESKSALEEAVVGAVNDRIHDLPVGFGYKDALQGASEQGWLFIHGDGQPGVVVHVPEQEPDVAVH